MVRLLLSNSQIAEIRARLRGQREQARAAIEQSCYRDGFVKMNGAASVPRFDDYNSTRGLRARLELLDYQRNITQIEDVNDALAALDEGTYGICSGCGSPIEFNRLQNNPALRVCLACRRSTKAVD